MLLCYDICISENNTSASIQRINDVCWFHRSVNQSVYTINWITDKCWNYYLIVTNDVIIKWSNCSQKKNRVVQHIPVQVVLASSSLLSQSFVPSQSHLLGMQRLLLHLNWSVGHVWLTANVQRPKKKKTVTVLHICLKAFSVLWPILSISGPSGKQIPVLLNNTLTAC